MSKNARNIHQFLIQPFQQIRIGIYFILLSLVFMFASAYIFFDITYDQHANVMKIFNVVETATKWDLVANDVVIRGLIKVSILLIGYSIATFIIAVLLTHRIYGPLVSISNFLDLLIKGDYSKRVTIRKKDELKELVSKLNKLAESLEGQK